MSFPDTSQTIRLLLTGGGTGGHLFPAIATAHEFQRRFSKTEILFVGTRRKLDTESLSRYGFSSKSISCLGVKGKSPVQLAKALLYLPLGYMQSLMLLRNFRPDIVFGVGGYVTVPVIAAARTLGIAAVIHEQNAVPGLANRKLVSLVDKVCLSLPESMSTFRQSKMVLTGNPVRKTISQQAEKTKQNAEEMVTVLVLGGSQGAHSLNILLPKAINHLKQKSKVKIIHQTGEKDVARVRQAYQAAGVEARVDVFFTDMATVYGDADVVVSRAGATTLAELAVLGKPALLIPYPYAADNHQEKNGEFYVGGGGALMFKESDIDSRFLADALGELLADSERLETMSASMKSLAFPNAAADIVDVCCALMNKGGELDV